MAHHRIEEVASPHAWHHDPRLVWEFHSMRRRVAASAKPNPAHFALANLEQKLEDPFSSALRTRTTSTSRQDRCALSNTSAQSALAMLVFLVTFWTRLKIKENRRSIVLYIRSQNRIGMQRVSQIVLAGR